MPETRKRAITIRPAARSDIAGIIPVVNAAFSVEAFLEGTRTDDERMAELMDKGEFLIAVEKDQIVASMYCEVRGEHCYLGMLAVEPSQQGTGLARIMIFAAEEYSRNHGCKYIDIIVLSLRPELLPFYQKLGFKEIGTQEFRPSRPLKAGVQCHGIQMTKSL